MRLFSSVSAIMSAKGSRVSQHRPTLVTDIRLFSSWDTQRNLQYLLLPETLPTLVTDLRHESFSSVSALCRQKPPSSLNIFPPWSQKKGFSPVRIRWWTFKLHDCLKLLVTLVIGHSGRLSLQCEKADVDAAVLHWNSPSLNHEV